MSEECKCEGCKCGKEPKWCESCGRLKEIACTCGMSFKEKIKSTNLNWASWSDTRG